MSVPIFVIHCKTGLEQRRESIRAQMQTHKLSFEFILDFDRTEIPASTAEKYFSPNYPTSLMSVCLKHRLATERLVASGESHALIFEDDVIFLKNFETDLKEILNEAKTVQGDYVVYLSNYGNRYTPRSRLRKGKKLYPNNHSRACDSYLLSLGAAQKRLAWWENNKYTLPIDHQFNVIDSSQGIQIFWAEDPISEQGSDNGTFVSCIEQKQGPMIKKLRWNLDKFYKKHVLRNLR